MRTPWPCSSPSTLEFAFPIYRPFLKSPLRALAPFNHLSETPLTPSLLREMIKETPDDMFTFLPPESNFLKEFRNPCWKAKDLVGEEKLFCVPYFYIIGFTKCGE